MHSRELLGRGPINSLLVPTKRLQTRITNAVYGDVLQEEYRRQSTTGGSK